MSRKINDLVPELRDKASSLLSACEAAHVRMVPSETLRTPWQQAIYWRQSRSRTEIDAAIKMLKDNGASFLARVLDSVGPHSGDEVTKVLPGNSWHQWGEAMDCFWEVNGAAVWSTTKKIDGVNGYSVYADKAEAAGLNAGLHWGSFKDPPHVQLRATANPRTSGLSWAQIDATMEQRFGGEDPHMTEMHVAAFRPEAATAAPDRIRLAFVSQSGWRVFETTDRPAAVFRAKMSIDADGAPKAYNKNSAIALDFLANAGRPGNWWALVTDGNGNPIVQGSGDPAPGYYISTTTLTYPNTDPNKPAHYVDASTIPYFVLPSRKYTSFTSSGDHSRRRRRRRLQCEDQQARIRDLRRHRAIRRDRRRVDRARRGRRAQRKPEAWRNRREGSCLCRLPRFGTRQRPLARRDFRAR